ncbi:MAG: RNA polymerase sigma factor, partial [Planctomycetaceae bacterium]
MSNLISHTPDSAADPLPAFPDLVSISDADLLDGWVRDRQAEAFSVLVRRYSSMVLSVCRRRCRSDSDADDAFQSTFFYLARNAHKIRRPERLAGWLHRVAQRASLATVSKAGRGGHPMNDIDPLAKLDDPLHRLTQRHEAVVLDEELADLPEHYRVALVLHILEGFSLERLAEQLGITVGTVRGQLQRGKKLLAQRLRRRGVVPVLAYAAAVASTVSKASASDAVDSLLKTIGREPLPTSTDAPDTSYLDPLVHEGLQMMKLPFVSIAAVTAGLLMTLALLADESGSGQRVTAAHIVDFPAMAAQIGGDAGIQPSDDTEGDFGMSSAPLEPSPVAARPPQTMIWAPKSVMPKPTGEIAEQAELALREPMTLTADLTLGQLPDYLSEQIGSPVRLDDRAISLAKIDVATAIHFHNTSLPLRAALHRLLNPLGLQIVVREEGLVITADPAAQVRNGINDSRWINVDEEAEEKIATALTQPASVNFVDEPLENALAILAEQHKIAIDIDRGSLEEIGLSVDTLVTLSLENVKLESVLTAIADENDLTFTVRHERLRLLTREADEVQSLIRIYWLEGIGLPSEANEELMAMIQ